MKNSSLSEEMDRIKRAFALAEAEKPAYKGLYPLLKPLFLLQAEAATSLRVDSLEMDPQRVQTLWEGGFPLVRRWDFPLDTGTAERMLRRVDAHIPAQNQPMSAAHAALSEALSNHPSGRGAIWQSFLQHELEPWEEWMDTEGIDVASLIFLARSCLRPSLEWTAKDLLRRFPLPKSWLRGYCPLCGSLPSLLFLKRDGERSAHCSWCGTEWGLHRLQCPHCDNRDHESLGYQYVEAEPSYRIQYCRLCKNYFKLIDTREMLDAPYFPLEEWTTLHLDLLAQRAGWQQPSSPSPAVYGAGANRPS